MYRTRSNIGKTHTQHAQLFIPLLVSRCLWVHSREQQSYPDHPERFEDFAQVLCGESVSGRCYWEAEWSGVCAVALTYKTIGRKGSSEDCVFGSNGKSWSLYYSNNTYYVRHNERDMAGSLSFYSVSSDTHSHTYTHGSSRSPSPSTQGFGCGTIPQWVCVSYREAP